MPCGKVLELLDSGGPRFERWEGGGEEVLANGPDCGGLCVAEDEQACHVGRSLRCSVLAACGSKGVWTVRRSSPTGLTAGACVWRRRRRHAIWEGPGAARPWWPVGRRVCGGEEVLTNGLNCAGPVCGGGGVGMP